MLRTVGELLPQCDRMYLYLNGYDEVPAELLAVPGHEKLSIVLGNGKDAPDKGSQGKFHWVGVDDGYYLTVDDDIVYPQDYVESVVVGIERYARKAVVGYHGTIFKLAGGRPTSLPRFMRDSRVLYRYDSAIPRDVAVHMLGNGVAGCHARTLGLTPDVCCGPLHSGDDEDLAVWAQAHGVPLVRLAGRNGWITADRKSASLSPLHSRTAYMNMADAKLRGVQHWTLAPLKPVPVEKDDPPKPPKPTRPTNPTNPTNPSRTRQRVVSSPPPKLHPNNVAPKLDGRNVHALMAKIPAVATGPVMSDKSVVVAMATFPQRKDGFLRVVADILPQCDKLYVYMNGYSAIPDGLPASDKLQIVLAGPGAEHPDIGSHGKMYWVGVDEGYYLTVDDDILYPADYCAEIVRGVEKYDRKAIVGYHGGIYRVNQAGHFGSGTTASKRLLHGYDRSVKADMPVHTLGCGVMGCHPKSIRLTADAFRGAMHSGDDEDLALWAQATSTPLVRLVGRDKWITPNDTAWRMSPLHRRPDFIAAADRKLKAHRGWKLTPLPQSISKPVFIRGVKPTGPCMDRVDLSAADVAFCEKIMSSDALSALLVDRIKKRVPTSVIRMSDGERACIDHFRMPGGSRGTDSREPI